MTLIGLAMLLGTVIWLQQQNEQEFAGRVSVIDGDSLRLDGREIRLKGIDAPEYNQICVRDGKDWRCGIASRDALRKLVRRSAVTCNSNGIDQYGRWLSVCFVKGKEINLTMVTQGWALDFGGYANAEREAEREGRGIWKSKFDRPRVWRDLNRGAVAN